MNRERHPAYEFVFLLLFTTDGMEKSLRCIPYFLCSSFILLCFNMWLQVEQMRRDQSRGLNHGNENSAGVKSSVAARSAIEIQLGWLILSRFRRKDDRTLPFTTDHQG